MRNKGSESMEQIGSRTPKLLLRACGILTRSSGAAALPSSRAVLFTAAWNWFSNTFD